jgi:ParB-like chromosome segregation protein Spo0J
MKKAAQSQTLVVQDRAVADLVYDPRNSKKHDEKNIIAIAASLERFGQRKPIVVRDGVVIAGNGTLEAARRLGWVSISTTEAPLSEIEARAYALADNKTAELAKWDDGQLSE